MVIFPGWLYVYWGHEQNPPLWLVKYAFYCQELYDFLDVGNLHFTIEREILYS